MRTSALLTTLILLFSSCDPDKKDIFNTEAVKLKATINNTSETINLGDTLKITVQLPDTIQSNTGVFPVQLLQKAQFYMKLSRIDTIKKIAVLFWPPDYWTTKGSISGTNKFDFMFDKTAKPYGVTIHFKPPQKGLYYLEMVSQAGDIKINNSYEARLFVNFDVPDKHFNILSIISPYFGGQTFYDAFIQRDAQGFGTYFFRVI